MKILCTMPGRLGDIFWSLAAVRAVSEAQGEQIDFATSPKYSAALEVVGQQGYIRRCFAIEGWQVEETAPMTPVAPPPGDWERKYDYILHLGYTRWPALPLAFEIATRHAIPLTRADLSRPWLQVAPCHSLSDEAVAVGFTDEWFELKYGIVQLLNHRPLLPTLDCLGALGGRWHKEANMYCTLHLAFEVIASARVFLGDLSALAVLAAGLGKPRVLVEPNPQRHHPIFQHWDTPLVQGSDGLPTFDARHVADALREKLR